jgi:hypothetical protein
MNLTKLEENIVAKHVLNLISCEFSSRLAEVANMANSLRAERGLD